jgi:hypothetical protein
MSEEQIEKDYLEQQEIYYNIIDNVPLDLNYEEFMKLNKEVSLNHTRKTTKK